MLEGQDRLPSSTLWGWNPNNQEELEPGGTCITDGAVTQPELPEISGERSPQSADPRPHPTRGIRQAFQVSSRLAHSLLSTLSFTSIKAGSVLFL